MKQNNLIDAIVKCPEEGRNALVASMAVTKIKEHLSKMENERDYSMSRYYHKDLERGLDKEALKENEQRLVISFMYAMFELNKTYRKKTGKFLFEKLENSLKTAEMLYEELQAAM